MPLEERRERHAALLRANLEHNLSNWLMGFLDALRGDDSTVEETGAAMPDEPPTGGVRIPPLVLACPRG
jgi:trehalose-6-phosphate synthase